MPGTSARPPPLVSPKVGPRRKAAEAAAYPGDDSTVSYAAELPDERIEATGARHPECTSGADNCIGSTESRLVRHLHEGKAGDIYCEPCWASFYERNSNVQGEFLDDDEVV